MYFEWKNRGLGRSGLTFTFFGFINVFYMFETQKKNNLEGEISAMLNLGNKRRPSFYSCRPSFYSWRPSFYSFKHSMMRSTGPEKYSFEVFQKN